MFKKILIANRGEIAVRIIRSARKLGIATVAVYAGDDSRSLHVSMADEAYLLPGEGLPATYLNGEALINAALRSGATAIHPGYGFLSESAGFAESVEKSGLTFIGATAGQIRLMGDKARAVDFVEKTGIPVIPGMRWITGNGSQEASTPEEAVRLLSSPDFPGFPVMLKAVAGGGGKGMQIVRKAEEMAPALSQTRRQAGNYFGNDDIYVEKYMPAARHVEIQIMGDGTGNAVHLFERECSVQRRHQKLIEESPAENLSPLVKEALCRYSLLIAKAVNYRGAGTVEFLVDGDQACFLEMNTRLQVEHTVTEAVTGIDIVEWQLLVAAGEGLPKTQQEITCSGHAVEARIYAEDADKEFTPSHGTIKAVHIPAHTRWDSFIREDMTMSHSCDSLLGKMIVNAPSRAEALEKMYAALEKLLIGGLKTNQLFLLAIMRSSIFRTNKMTTCFLDEQAAPMAGNPEPFDNPPVNVLLAGYLLHNFYRPQVNTGPWSVCRFRRFHEAFQIEIDKTKYNLTISAKHGKTCVASPEITTKAGNGSFMFKNHNFGDNIVEVYDITPDRHSITFRYDNRLYEVMAYNDSDATVVQYKGCRFPMRSYGVAGEAAWLIRKATDKDICRTSRGNMTHSDDREERADGYSSKPPTSHGNETKDKPEKNIVAGLYGKIVDILIDPGDWVERGQNLLIVESMKTEVTIKSPADATVKAVHVFKGKMIVDNEILVDLEDYK